MTMEALPERINPLSAKGDLPLDPALDPDALISIVIPLKDEEGTVVELFEKIERVFDLMGREFEVIYVDDGSKDNSFNVLHELYRDNFEHVRVIRFRHNKGKAAALAAGFDLAKGEIIFTMDADLQDDPDEIPKFLERLAQGTDLVSGWKKVRHDPLHKVIFSRFFNWVVSRAAGLKLHDYNCGYKAYRKEVLEEIHLYGELHRYIPFLARHRGFNVGEIVVEHHPRTKGVSKYGMGRVFKGFFDLFTVITLTRFGRRPLHLFGSVGAILFFVGLIINLILTWQWFHGQPIGDRPLLIMGVLVMVVGVQIFTIGLVGEMVNSLRPSDQSDKPIKTILK